MALTNGGTPSSQNYEIGRGRLLLDLFDTSGNPSGHYLDVGNVSAFTLSAEEESLEHQSSLEGLATVDLAVTLSKKLTGAFTLEEITKENQEIFFSADLSTIVQSAKTDQTADLTIPASGVGRWYKLYDNGSGTALWLNNAGVPVFQITGTPDLQPAGGGTPYILGTDYEVDTDFGMIRLLTTGALSGGITVGDLKLSFAAHTYDKVRMLNRTVTRARLVFLHEDAYAGKKKMLRLHRIKLAASGDAAMIGDEWSQLGFEFTVESDSAFDANAPYGEIVPVA